MVTPFSGITVVDQGTGEKNVQSETSKMIDGGHDQMPDKIPKEDSDLGSAVWSLLHEYVFLLADVRGR